MLWAQVYSLPSVTSLILYVYLFSDIPLGSVTCYDDQDASIRPSISIQDGEEFIRITPPEYYFTSVFIRSAQAIDFEVRLLHNTILHILIKQRILGL